MNIIDGRALANSHHIKIKSCIEKRKITPSLCVILVGNHPPSLLYVQNKKKACESVGIHVKIHHFEENTFVQHVIDVIEQANQDPFIHGIFVQLPLPSHFDQDMIVQCINPQKDVDGLHPQNIGLLWSGKPYMIPCTPLGCLQLIQTVHPSLEGKHVVIVGRSNLVGRPMAGLLLLENATVTIIHSYSQNLGGLCQEADILVVAIGKPHFIRHVKKGATVIDVGINKTEYGLQGDVHPDVQAGHMTPVPGGVGPMTITNLLWNTYKASLCLS